MSMGATLRQLLGFLVTKEGRYDVQNSQLVFFESTDLAKFREFQEKIGSSANASSEKYHVSLSIGNRSGMS